MTGGDIVTAALMEIGAYSPGEAIQPPDMSFGIDKLNRIVDGWDAKRNNIYSVIFATFNLVANLAPHTIGPGLSGTITAIAQSNNQVELTVVNGFSAGQTLLMTGLTANTALNNYQPVLLGATATTVWFAYSGAITQGVETGTIAVPGIGPYQPQPTFPIQGNRPTKIIAANLIVTGSNPSYLTPINIRDADWWAAQAVQQLATNYPTDLYYSPDWPNGSLWFWPMPTITRPVQLEWWNTLQQFTEFGTFSMPPGYWDSLVYTLAENLCPAFEKAPTTQLIELARAARAKIQSLNSNSPRISTGRDGLPGGNSNRSAFNWHTGFNVGQ